jgi:cell division septum initiation protein DivIVA
LAVYLAAAAARFLHRAPATRAAIVFSLLGGCILGSHWWLRQQIARLAETAKAVKTAAVAAQDLGRQLQQAQQLAAPPEGETGGPPPDLPQDRTQALWGTAPPSSSGPAAISGLQLLAPLTGSPPPDKRVDGPEPQTQAEAQAKAIQQATSNMLAPIMAMLNNPALTRGMSPEQAKQMNALVGAFSQMQAGMTSGKKLSPQEEAALLAKFQGALMQLTSQIGTMSSSARQESAAKGPRGSRPPRSDKKPKQAPAPETGSAPPAAGASRRQPAPPAPATTGD